MSQKRTSKLSQTDFICFKQSPKSLGIGLDVVLSAVMSAQIVLNPEEKMWSFANLMIYMDSREVETWWFSEEHSHLKAISQESACLHGIMHIFNTYMFTLIYVSNSVNGAVCSMEILDVWRDGWGKKTSWDHQKNICFKMWQLLLRLEWFRETSQLLDPCCRGHTCLIQRLQEAGLGQQCWPSSIHWLSGCPRISRWFSLPNHISLDISPMTDDKYGRHKQISWSTYCIFQRRTITPSPPSQTYLSLHVDCKPINGFPIKLSNEEKKERTKAKRPQKVPHLPRKEQQATPDFITDSMMQLATTVVQLWFCWLY